MITTTNTDISALNNIICRKGDSFKIKFRYWTDSTRTNPIDITASDFKIDVRRSGALLFSFTIGDGLAITSPNILTASKTAEEMNVNPGVYEYDLQKTSVDELVITIMKGSFIIEKDVTL